MSLQVFSQKDTSDSIVVMPKSTVVKIVKDLERYDLCKKESLIKDSIILDYKTVVFLKDSTITKFKEKEASYNKEILFLNKIDSSRVLQLDNLNGQIKDYKNQRNISAAVSVALLILSIFL